MAATFSLTRSGYPVVEDAAFLAVNANWLPYDTTAGYELLEATVAAGRRFTIPLRYGAAATPLLPTLVLTDSPEPVAAYTATTSRGAEHAQHAADDAGVPAWIWRSEHALPPLPAPR